MTRLFNPPIVIPVLADWLGTPISFIWRGQRHQVSWVANRWRVDQDWQRGRIWREYFKLVTTASRLVIVYRDVLEGTWYLQRTYE